MCYVCSRHTVAFHGYTCTCSTIALCVLRLHVVWCVLTTLYGHCVVRVPAVGGGGGECSGWTVQEPVLVTGTVDDVVVGRGGVYSRYVGTTCEHTV